MAINYKKTKKASVPSQNLHYDPRSKANVKRARNVISQGDTVTVQGTYTRKPQKATWF
jgi:hypothetical protein|tara:strand:- start:10 stop:183 length:174 start_codon:yes stop_codon:yes gene_type:complete